MTILAPLRILFTELEIEKEVEIIEEEVNFEQLAKELENASPLEIMDKALEKFGIKTIDVKDVVLKPYLLKNNVR